MWKTPFIREDFIFWVNYAKAKKKKLCLFPVTRQTLIFCSDPKVFIAFDDSDLMFYDP